MDRLFEPGALELADPHGDPSRVIEVQQQVQELLEANRQRREGIRQELIQRGAWALPGLMNATYVWMNELESSPPDQDLLSSMMADLAADNPAAAELLFRYGILETPFSTPRSIARKALRRIDWKPTAADLQDLRETLNRYRQLEGTQTVIDLYDVLLSACQEDDFREALDLCKLWARQSMKPAGELMALLIKLFPERASEILVEVFLAVKDKYKDKNLAELLLQSLRDSIPVAWLREGVLLQVSRDVLPNTVSKRHTAVEYLWVYAVQNCRDQAPEVWQELLHELDNQVRQQDDAEVYRYWFEAMGRADEVEYLAQQAQADTRDEQWGIRAACQLLFLQRYHRLAKQALEDLKRESPARYERASRLFETITGSPGKIEGETEEGPRIGHLV